MAQKFWNYCGSCCQKTKHSILFNISRGDIDPKYRVEYGKSTYFTLECNGCESISFRSDYVDYTNPEIAEDTGEYIYNVTSDFYPNELENHKSFRYTYYLPQKIRIIYEQTILAFKGKSKLLTGVGFRAVIEAVCMEEKIKGHNLEQKINNLAKNRLITERESERLHSIRFLGNDSVHDIEVPSDSKLFMVLNIIENLLQNLYIIDRSSKNVLDTIIKDFKDFKFLLIKCLANFNVGDIKSVNEILGKHIRRIPNNIPLFESTLLDLIKTNDFEYLKIDTAHPNKYQILKVEDDDDLPF